jgi:hypothetical protein
MIPYNLTKNSNQPRQMLNAFQKRNAMKMAKIKINNPKEEEQEDSFQSIENSRKDFAQEYLAKYGDANIERRAIPISNYPSPDSFRINQIDFNPNIYTPEYNCYTLYTILKNYKQNKNDINKLKLKTLLSDSDCLRMFDTIGKNKYDPSNWIIPDGQFRSLLKELDILAPYNPNIKNIIQIRRKAKTFPYRIKKLIAGKTKRKGKEKIRKGRKTKRTQRKSTNKK